MSLSVLLSLVCTFQYKWDVLLSGMVPIEMMCITCQRQKSGYNLYLLHISFFCPLFLDPFRFGIRKHCIQFNSNIGLMIRKIFASLRELTCKNDSTNDNGLWNWWQKQQNPIETKRNNKNAPRTNYASLSSLSVGQLVNQSS